MGFRLRLPAYHFRVRYAPLSVVKELISADYATELLTIVYAELVPSNPQLEK